MDSSLRGKTPRFSLVSGEDRGEQHPEKLASVFFSQTGALTRLLFSKKFQVRS